MKCGRVHLIRILHHDSQSKNGNSALINPWRILWIQLTGFQEKNAFWPLIFCGPWEV
jgi:hypothetical protein